MNAAMRKAAQTYAARGWPVFISHYLKELTCRTCRETHSTTEDFENCTCLRCHGLYAATTDQDRIRKVATATKKGMVCVRTGAVSGLVAVELTRPAGLRYGVRLEHRGYLPDTLTILEGEGGYLLYRHPGGYIKSGTNLLGPGVHLHADDGYIPMPPSRSRKSGLRLEWLGGTPDRAITPLHPGILDILRVKESTRGRNAK